MTERRKNWLTVLLFIVIWCAASEMSYQDALVESEAHNAP